MNAPDVAEVAKLAHVEPFVEIRGPHALVVADALVPVINRLDGEKRREYASLRDLLLAVHEMSTSGHAKALPPAESPEGGHANAGLNEYALMSAHDAARELRTSRKTIIRRIARGELVGRKVAGRWLVERPADCW